ncbi:MAG TPA: hypothetical protein VF407_21370, partial [Polyangiaceae bacterium]
NAALMLTGDPGTKVWVDGKPQGACPVRVPVSATTHEVKFTFGPTGESRSEHVKAVVDHTTNVRADFTGATPLIHVGK